MPNFGTQLPNPTVPCHLFLAQLTSADKMERTHQITSGKATERGARVGCQGIRASSERSERTGPYAGEDFLRSKKSS